MARKIKEGERAARIDEILDAAQALIQTKGYEQMTIQDLLDALGISKGAFYYYFDSKQALLEALVERMVEQVMAVLRPLVDDERLPALAKLEAVFRTAAGWKDERRDLLAELTRVWYADENVLVRDKLERSAWSAFARCSAPSSCRASPRGPCPPSTPTWRAPSPWTCCAACPRSWSGG